MNCPYCSSSESSIILSRKDGESRYRMRECKDCQSLYLTSETVQWVGDFKGEEKQKDKTTPQRKAKDKEKRDKAKNVKQ